MYNYTCFYDLYYYISVLISFFLLLIAIFSKKNKLIKYLNIGYVFFLMLLLFIKPIGRGVGFPDTDMYASWFNYAKQNNEIYQFKDIGFNLFLLFLAKIGNLRFFFTAITLLIFALILVIGKRLSKEYYYIFMVLSVVSVYSFTFLTSLLRQEIAVLFIVLSLLYDRKIIKYSLMVIASLFHMSVILLVIPILLLDFFSIKFRYLLVFWILSSVLSYILEGKYLHYFELFSFAENRIHYIIDNDPKSGYYTSKTFRWDFWLFSLLFILNISYQILSGKINGSRYLFIAKVFVLSNTIWLYFMFSNHTNRFVILSLSLIPIILTIQLFNEKKENINFHFTIIFFAFSVLNMILYVT